MFPELGIGERRQGNAEDDAASTKHARDKTTPHHSDTISPQTTTAEAHRRARPTGVTTNRAN
jgi:hypothetical protein